MLKQRLEQYEGTVATWADPHARSRGLRIRDIDGSKLMESPDDPQRSAFIDALLARRRADREGAVAVSR